MNKLFLPVFVFLLVLGCTELSSSGVPTLGSSPDFKFTTGYDTSISYSGRFSLYNPLLKVSGEVTSNTVINFGCSGLPEGLSCNFPKGKTCTISSTQQSCSRSVEFLAVRTIEPKVYTIQLTASDGTTTKTLNQTLLITGTGLEGISLRPMFATAARGETVKLNAIINQTGLDIPMYDDPVTVVWGNLPAGVRSTINELPCERLSSGICLRYYGDLELSIDSSAGYLPYTLGRILMVYAVDSNGVPKNAKLQLSISPNFSLLASPISSIAKGSSSKTVIQVNAVSGEPLSDFVLFRCNALGRNGSISNLPAGVSCSFSSNSCGALHESLGATSCKSTLLVSASSSIKPQGLQLRIIGSNQDRLERYLDMNITIN